MSETDINALILAAITHLPGVMAWRNNSGLLYAPTGHRVRASVAGAPDIIAVCKGRFVGLETKTESGRQRPTQINFQKACERAGGIYAIVRSADEALAVLARAA